MYYKKTKVLILVHVSKSKGHAIKALLNNQTFSCSSASLFCLMMLTRNSSHCFWYSATFTLASSSSLVILSTLPLVSMSLFKPFLSLSAESPSSLYLTSSKLCEEQCCQYGKEERERERQGGRERDYSLYPVTSSR